MSIHDETYHRLLLEVKRRGVFKMDRTGTGTISRFGTQSRCDLSEVFPLLPHAHNQGPGGGLSVLLSSQVPRT